MPDPHRNCSRWGFIWYSFLFSTNLPRSSHALRQKSAGTTPQFAGGQVRSTDPAHQREPVGHGGDSILSLIINGSIIEMAERAVRIRVETAASQSESRCDAHWPAQLHRCC